MASTASTATQTTGLKRTTVDKYYTSPDIVNTCMNFIKETINISDNDICIEPSAGNGSFIPSIKNICNNYVFYDIEPEHDDIIKKDFLEKKVKKHTKNYDRVIYAPGSVMLTDLPEKQGFAEQEKTQLFQAIMPILERRLLL